MRNRMWEEGGVGWGGVSISLGRARSPTERAEVLVTPRCDWWSALRLSPLPLLKKEVQLERQTQTAQDSEVGTQ